ncbi:MAG: MATE family efflux transporter [Gammaproteobacteria bacterium]|nr:MATE family efflux transporter [Gammaproteobacteria bacterium]
MATVDQNKTSYLVELRQLGYLAAPIVIAQVSYMALNVVDVVVSGQYGVVDQAGVALGQSAFSPLTLLAMGALMAVTPTVAQLHGAKKTHETGPIVRQALWLSLFLALVIIAIMYNLEPLYHAVGVDEVAIPVSMGYLKALSFGIPAFLAFYALRNLCEGLEMTLSTMLIVLSALALKIPLTYGLVFGIGEFNGFGGAGCGIASAIVFWYMLIAMVVAISMTRLRESRVFERFDTPKFDAIGRLAILGFPMGLTIFVEIAFFSASTILIGRLGVVAVAAHQIVLSVGLIGFMTSYSICIATTIRSALHVGGGNTQNTNKTALASTTIAVGLGVVFVVILLLLHNEIASVYSSSDEVLKLTTPLFMLCAVFLFLDTIQHSFIGTLRGFKDATVPMIQAASSFWCVGMPVGIVLTFGLVFVQPLGVHGFWYGLIVAATIASMLQFVRVRWVLRNAHMFVPTDVPAKNDSSSDTAS